MTCTDGCSATLPELQQQHERVFDRFAFVKKAMAKGRGWNNMHSALTTLIKCIESCFAMEEALMRFDEYPGWEDHRQEHMDLLHSLRAMEIANLTTGLTENQIGTAFAATMKHHLTQDRRYARYLPQVGATTRISVND